MKAGFKLNVIFASVGGIGFFPFAPGTVATAFALLLYLFVKPTMYLLLSTVIILSIIGIFVSDKAEQQASKTDPSWVVIDEVVGFGVSVLFLQPTAVVALIAFFLFRFFDIIKPPPIRTVERILKGGLAIMVDDIIAGVFANFILRILLALGK